MKDSKEEQVKNKPFYFPRELINLDEPDMKTRLKSGALR